MFVYTAKRCLDILRNAYFDADVLCIQEAGKVHTSLITACMRVCHVVVPQGYRISSRRAPVQPFWASTPWSGRSMRTRPRYEFERLCLFVRHLCRTRHLRTCGPYRHFAQDQNSLLMLRREVEIFPWRTPVCLRSRFLTPSWTPDSTCLRRCLTPKR